MANDIYKIGKKMKSAKDYLDEANAVVRKIDFNEAIEKHKKSAA